MNRKFSVSYWVGIMVLLAACTSREPLAEAGWERLPSVFPDYTGVTIPCNIAPLRFMLEEDSVEKAIAVIGGGTGRLVVKADAHGSFPIPEKGWKTLLERSKGDSLEVKVYACKGGHWGMYRPFWWHVVADAIDPYLVYRLIEPGYVMWYKMGIYQRNLTSFRQEAILSNDRTGYNCMNCHSFNRQEPGRMLFHMRDKWAGSYLAASRKVSRLKECIVDGKPQSLVYPSWHPSGRFIAFSLNQTRQAFHLNDRNRVEVLDMASDVVVYDLEKDEILADPLLMRAASFETFPSFSPDGNTLYFCSASAQKMPDSFDKVRYSLCAISFDTGTRRFGTQVDTLYNANTEHRSASFPRVSPDGRFLVFTVSGYGNFSIWHKDAELWMLDLADGHMEPMAAANSDDVESYHSWSSNSRWMVFSSRRMDGLYTHPYLVYVDADGICRKPFVVPQSAPAFYKNFMYSFNIPELVKGKVELNSRQLREIMERE